MGKKQLVSPKRLNFFVFSFPLELLKESESQQRGTELGTAFRSQEYIGRIIAGFNSRWKNSLDAVNKEVLSSFPNFKNGTEILQMALTQFVQYYHRFHKIV